MMAAHVSDGDASSARGSSASLAKVLGALPGEAARRLSASASPAKAYTCGKSGAVHAPSPPPSPHNPSRASKAWRT